MFDKKKLYSRVDAEKWAHPELAEQYANLTSNPDMADFLFNMDLTPEQRKENFEMVRKTTEEYTSTLVQGLDRREIVSAPGCEEEPETEVELVIYKPLEQTNKRLPILYFIPGSGLYITILEAANPWKFADKLQCVVVCPRYRNGADARYPAAINDCHAGYNYILAHAKEFGANPNRVVIMGQSSGSHLALSLAYRLKRYGITPRGCVTICTLPDNRPTGASKNIYVGGNWAAKNQYLASAQYVGTNKLATIDDPEVYPNYATAEDSVGLCPVFIHADTEISGASACRQFTDTLTEAGVYNELHVWGGSCYSSVDSVYAGGDTTGYGYRYGVILEGNIADCWKYDLTRSWIKDL